MDILNDVVKALPEELQVEVLSYARKLQNSKSISSSTKEDKFWKLIDLIELQQQEDDKKVLPLITALAESADEEIYDFIDILDQKLHDIDGPSYMETFSNSEYGASSDGFLYGRCFVVAQGQIIYNQVKANPGKFPPGVWFEKLLHCASEAWELKTGEALDYFSGVIYETGWNEQLWGKSMAQETFGITEDDIRRKATPRKRSRQSE